MSTAVFGALEIKARNGLYVRQCENGGVEVGAETQAKDYTPPAATFALDEFFQAKRDAELGRWRWPENPDYVVYPRSDGVVLVLFERNSEGGILYRRGDPVHDMESEAARAYFGSHHEPKPWHSAKQPEVWVLTHVKGETGAFIVDGNRFESGPWSLPLDSASITEGRRIWPVDETLTADAPAAVSSQAGLASIRGGL